MRATSHRRLLAAVSAAGLAIGLASPVPAGAAPSDAVTATTIATFEPDVGPEGITVTPDGSVYVSTSTGGEVWEVHPDGSASVEVTLADVPEGSFGVLGLDSDHTGRLYAAAATGEAATNGVWSWHPGDEPRRIPGTEAIAFPNAITTGPDGAIYITSSFSGAVWRAAGPAGPAELWLQDESLEGTGAFLGPEVPVGANGIAVQGRAVYVAVTERAQVVRVAIDADGGPGEVRVLVASDELAGVDGLAAGPDGAIYAAVIATNSVVRVGIDGAIDVLATAGDGLDTPSSLAFGHGAQRGSLFVVNFAIGELLGVPPGAGPGVVRLDGAVGAVGPVEARFAAYLSGRAEVPPNASPAWGWSLWRVREDATRLTFSATISPGLENVVGIHLHLGSVGENGPIVAPIPLGGGGYEGGPGSGPYSRFVGSISASDLTGPLEGEPMTALFEAIESGDIYVNVHTDDGVAPGGTGPGDLPAGEIRGQLVPWS